MSWTHERVETIHHRTEVKQLGMNYLRYDMKFKAMRKDIKGCGLCLTPFEDKQIMHIAIASPGNKLICQSCADEAIRNGVPVPMVRDASPNGSESTESAQ